MNLVTKIRHRLFLLIIFIVNRFRVRNRFNDEISIKWRVIVPITIFKLILALLIAEKGMKSDRVRIHTKVIRIKDTFVDTSFNEKNNNIIE